jgi:hypothetical protein
MKGSSLVRVNVQKDQASIHYMLFPHSEKTCWEGKGISKTFFFGKRA